MRYNSKKAILLKLESVYGVDPTLAAEDALQVQNFQMVPFQASMANRDVADASSGADPEAPVGVYRTVTFDIFLSGSGEAGTPPLWGSTARACSMLETVIEDTSVEYTPVTGGAESAALGFFLDGQRRKMLGAKGSMVFKFNGGALSMASVTMSGLLIAVDADAAFPTPADIRAALADFVPALEVNKANTTHSLHGHAAVLDSLEMTQGNNIIFRDRPQAAYIAVPSRRSTGKCVIEAPTLTTKNHGAIFLARTTGAQQLVHGTVAGNIVQFDATAAQLGAPADTDLNGIAGLDIPLLYTKTDGDDEWKVTVK